MIITCIPTRGFIFTEVQDALDKELAVNREIPIILRTHDLTLPISRNFLVEQALKMEGWTHLLFLDDDVVMPEGGLKALKDAKADVAIIDYPMHTMKGDKGVGTVVTDKDGSVAWAGLGCCLIKREVFEKLQQPWFVFTNHRIMRDKDGRIGFFAGDNGTMRFSGGEDVHFFLQCRKENLSIKKVKPIARHGHIETVISAIHNNRYQQVHKIVYKDKIDQEIF